jgi:acetaldehyde dehydrogenase/alcohol dehydrogenase
VLSLAGLATAADDKVLPALLPTDLDELAAHPFIAEKLMPARRGALAIGRARVRACELVTEHGGLGHLGRLRHRRGSDQSLQLAIRTGRILVNAPTAVGALGGIYNSMPPTFSLGCGTWGGSNTTTTSTTEIC